MRKVRNRITCYKIKFRFCFSIPVCAFIVILKDSTARRWNRTHFCTRVLFSVQSTHTKRSHESHLLYTWTLDWALFLTFEWTNTQNYCISNYPINTIGYVLSERKEGVLDPCIDSSRCRQSLMLIKEQKKRKSLTDLDWIAFVTSVYILFACCSALTTVMATCICVCDYFGDAFQ